MEKEIINKDRVADIIIGLLEGRLEKSLLDGYSSPLDNIVREVVEERSEEIKKLYRGMLDEVLLNNLEIKKEIKQEFKRKIAKNLVAKLEGQVEKSVEVLRQDPTLRSKMILAIEKIVNDNLN